MSVVSSSKFSAHRRGNLGGVNPCSGDGDVCTSAVISLQFGMGGPAGLRGVGLGCTEPALSAGEKQWLHFREFHKPVANDNYFKTLYFYKVINTLASSFGADLTAFCCYLRS